jgi:hypothetical protein
MKKLYFTEIDDQFDPKNDILLGPWCLPNFKSVQAVHFVEPYSRDEILPMHRKLFDLAFFLLNRDIEDEEEKLKRKKYLLLQKDYLFFIFFVFSRYRALKKILKIASIDEIVIEDVDRPEGQDIFPWCFEADETGYLGSEVLKWLAEGKNIQKFHNANKISKVKSNLTVGCASRTSFFLFLKIKIKKTFNYFWEISGVCFFQGALLSFLYNVINVVKKSDFSAFLYEPKIAFDDEINEFIKIFDKLSSSFINKEIINVNSGVPKLTIKYPSFMNRIAEYQAVVGAGLAGKTKFIILQHGGVYANYSNHFRREIEYNFTSFVTWGKKYVSYINRKNIINNLPSPPLSAIANSYILKGQKNIVWVTGVHYKGGDGLEYLYGADVLKYIEKKVKFYEGIEGPLKEVITYKALKQSSLQFYDEMQSILGTKYVTDGTAIERMYDAKLVFIDYYGTPFYEAMSMNVPVVLGFFECEPLFTDDASAIFQKFEDAGVVYRTPEAAAQFLNEMYHKDIKQWWHDEKIQKIRREFLEMYANNKPYFWPWLKAILKREI